jgi:N-acetylneuraminate synthase
MRDIDSISIEACEIGPGKPCLIIGEVAQAHDGGLGTAHAFVDAIASAGADAVKFQTHIAEAESTPAEPWRVKFSLQDVTRYDYWKRMAFTEDQWKGLAQHARERGLVFLSSPFSLEAIELLVRVGVPAWKIASGEVSNTGLLERVAETGLPVLMSSGMSPLAEMDAAVKTVKGHSAPLAVLQCTSAYPCPPEKVGLNLIRFYRERYGCPVGLSDHSGSVYTGLAAAALGADVLEVHVTLSREMFGPDVVASVTTSEFRQLVDGIRYIERINANPVDKDDMAREMEPLRELFTKSVVAQADIPAGATIRREHLAAKKPGTGIPAGRLPDLLGKRLRRSVKVDELLAEDDFE